MGAVGYFGYDQLMAVGTTKAFQGKRELTALWDSPLAYIAGAGMVTLIAGWIMALWRITLYARASHIDVGALGSTRQSAQQPMAGTRKAPRAKKRSAPKRRK